MKTRTRVVLQLAAMLVLAAFAMADDNGYLYIVHGIPGRDVSPTINPGYPVDVLVNGKTCIARGLTFGNSYGPYTLAAGTYDIAISEANNLAGCTNPAIVTGSVTLTAGESASAVATLNAGAPALLTYTDDLSTVGQGTARFVFVNSADEPALRVTLTQLFGKSPKTYTITANAEAQQEMQCPPARISSRSPRRAERSFWPKKNWGWPISPSRS